MASHISTGKAGELIGTAHLAENGFKIMEQNWRFGRWEVDVIASKEMVLHFIEIKTRRSGSFGYPEEKVGKKKIQHLINAAEAYLYAHPEWQRIQFDILAITLIKNKPAELFFIEDVFL